MINIFIADDHAIFREGLKKLLREEPDFNVVVDTGNPSDVSEMIGAHNIDIVILDITFPNGNGLEILKDILKKEPKTPVLILSMHPEERYAVRALRAGAAGYVTKTSIPEELVCAIRTIVSGHKYVSKTMGELLADSMPPDRDGLPHRSLSDREYQIFVVLAAGVPVKKICEDLCLSASTVKTYRLRILEKMGMSSNYELTRYAIQHRLID